jgi:hypothetical protein
MAIHLPNNSPEYLVKTLRTVPQPAEERCKLLHTFSGHCYFKCSHVSVHVRKPLYRQNNRASPSRYPHSLLKGTILLVEPELHLVPCKLLNL